MINYYFASLTSAEIHIRNLHKLYNYSIILLFFTLRSLRASVLFCNKLCDAPCDELRCDNLHV